MSRATERRATLRRGGRGGAARRSRWRRDVAETQSALGFALFSGRLDVRAARAPYERSLRARRRRCRHAEPLRPLLRALRPVRRGARGDRQAAALDPLNARTFRSVGDVEYSARRYAGSIPPVERALAAQSEAVGAWAAIGASRLMMGEMDEARQAFEQGAKQPVRPARDRHRRAKRQGEEQQARAGLAQLIASMATTASTSRRRSMPNGASPRRRSPRCARRARTPIRA